MFESFARASRGRVMSMMEGLEVRRLLAAGASLDARGILNVEGTDQADTITITPATYRKGKSAVQVKVNDQTFVFARKLVHGIHASGGAGNDSIKVENVLRITTTTPPSGQVILEGVSREFLVSQDGGPITVIRYLGNAINVPATLLGEGGNDTLKGSGGDDWLEGGDGDDSMGGEGGKDRLYGDGGNDSVYGGPHSDTLYGGDGDDDLDGDRSLGPNLIVWDGDGNGGGNQFTFVSGVYRRSDSGVLYARSKDVIFGGAGADTFHKEDLAREIKDLEDADEIV